MNKYDLIVVGAGGAGITLALTASDHGMKTLLLEASPKAGGTLQIASGQMSAAGTKLQKSKGIDDSPNLHFADVMRISRYTANSGIVNLAVNNAADTFDWLMDNGFEPLPDHPILGFAHEPYSVERYYWGPKFGNSILSVLEQELERVVAEGNLEVLFNTRVVSIDGGEDGQPVRGVSAIDESGQVITFESRSVALASGGYNGSPEEFAKRTGKPLLGALSFPFARGDVHKLVEQKGGSIVGSEKFLCSYGAVLSDFNFPSKVAYRPETRPEVRLPWEITVNLQGKRFLAEDEPSVDMREHALVVQPKMRRFIVFDQTIKEEAPPLFPLNDQAEIEACFGNHPMFLKSNTLEGLAELMGVPATTFHETVDEYNSAERDIWNRKYRPRKIQKGPFYAVVVHGISVTSTSGVEIGLDFRVKLQSGRSVPNLYAIGELIGAGQTMGNSFCGGMMATPALTFGRLLGNQLAEERSVT